MILNLDLQPPGARRHTCTAATCTGFGGLLCVAIHKIVIGYPKQYHSSNQSYSPRKKCHYLSSGSIVNSDDGGFLLAAYEPDLDQAMEHLERTFSRTAQWLKFEDIRESNYDQLTRRSHRPILIKKQQRKRSNPRGKPR